MQTIRARRSVGFTLIEILVAMAIMVTLTALLATSMGIARDKAKRSKTSALINKIKVALEAYNSEFRDYPPDGYDTGDANPLGMKGSSALIFYLCRPLTKTSYIGADPTASSDDLANKVVKKVGPFLQLDADNFSRSELNPNHSWDGTDADPYWKGEDYRLTEIIDGYGRPICYDRVKTADPKHWQVNRFHKKCDGNVHPDQDYRDAGGWGLFPDDEPNTSVDVEEIELSRPDPRFKPSENGEGPMEDWVTALEDGSTGDSLPAASKTTHEPKFLGGYDLWSSGKSFMDPRDDVTSWGE